MKLDFNSVNFLVPVILLILVTSCDNTNIKVNAVNPNIDTVQQATSWQLPIPQGWTTERIPFPIDFAPGIKYTGVEDLRFTPGWGNVTHDEHWCYAFLWWLDGKPAIDAAILQQNLTEYYSGLVKRNIVERSIPAIKTVPTVAAFKKTETSAGDTATYTGTINMLDYIAQDPIILNCMVHVKKCDTQNHTGVFFEISPKPYGHSIWQQLDKLNIDFKCGD